MTDFGPLIEDHCVCPGIMSLRGFVCVCVYVCVLAKDGLSASVSTWGKGFGGVL